MAQHKSVIILSRENYKKFLDLGDLYAILKAQNDQLIKDKADLLAVLKSIQTLIDGIARGHESELFLSEYVLPCQKELQEALNKHKIK